MVLKYFLVFSIITATTLVYCQSENDTKSTSLVIEKLTSKINAFKKEVKEDNKQSDTNKEEKKDEATVKTNDSKDEAIKENKDEVGNKTDSKIENKENQNVRESKDDKKETTVKIDNKPIEGNKTETTTQPKVETTTTTTTATKIETTIAKEQIIATTIDSKLVVTDNDGGADDIGTGDDGDNDDGDNLGDNYKEDSADNKGKLVSCLTDLFSFHILTI